MRKRPRRRTRTRKRIGAFQDGNGDRRKRLSGNGRRIVLPKAGLRGVGAVCVPLQHWYHRERERERESSKRGQQRYCVRKAGENRKGVRQGEKCGRCLLTFGSSSIRESEPRFVNVCSSDECSQHIDVEIVCGDVTKWDVVLTIEGEGRRRGW